MDKSQPSRGRLFYVIGASGAGKDSLMNAARLKLAGNYPLVFAHRYITRDVELSGENHIALTEQEFVNRAARGCFCMQWQSHGLSYGIGIEVQAWLALGLDVVMNGSRRYLTQATLQFPELMPLLIDVKLEVLEQRLIQRGRENLEQIKQRLERAQAFKELDCPGLVRLDNNQNLEVGLAKLISILMQDRSK